MTDIVIDAGRSVPIGQFRPIDVWRLCSSMAHGNRTISLAVLERRSQGERTPTGDTYLMTTSYRVIAVFVGVVAVVINAALDDLDRLNA